MESVSENSELDTALTVELDTACPNCKEQYSLTADDGTPKVLNCCHALCTKCCRLSAKTGEDNTIRCSLCATATSVDVTRGVHALLDHFPLMNELKRMEIENCKAGAILCDNCEVSNKANWKCLQCDTGCANLCDDCKVQHNGLKALRSHEVISLTEFAERSEHLVPTCSVHDEPVEVYCQDCIKTMCCSCAIHQHQAHTRCTISEGADIEKLDLERHIDTASDVVTRCHTEVEKIREVKDTLISHSSGLIDNVTTCFAELHELLRVREEAVKNDLTEMNDKKVVLLTKQIAALEDSIVSVEGTMDYAKLTTVCSPEQVLLSSQLTRKNLLQLKFFELASTPCQLGEMKSDLEQTTSISKMISSLGRVTDDTLPTPERCLLQQKSFCLVDSECGPIWEIICIVTMCNIRGEVITRDTGLLPTVTLTQAPPEAGNKEDNETQDNEKDGNEDDVNKDTEQVEDALKDCSLDDSSLSNNDNDVLQYTKSFHDGVWTITIHSTVISSLQLSVTLYGMDIHDSPLSIRRGKPLLYFGGSEGAVGPHSNLHSGFLSSMSIENLRSLEGNPVVWKRDHKVFRGVLTSHVVLQLTEAPQCILSHIVLKSSISDQYKLFYRSSNYEEDKSLPLPPTKSKDSEDAGSDDAADEDSVDKESVTPAGEWTPISFLTPDWTDIKEEQDILVDINEAQCKEIGYVNAIRLEVKSSTKSSANSFHGVNVYGWNVDV